MSQGLTAFEARALRMLKDKIDERSNTHALSLVSGAARGPDAASTAALYEHAIGYRRALTDVIAWMEETEDEILGRKKS